MNKSILTIFSIILLATGLFAQNTWMTLTTNEGLISNSVKCLDVDNQGNIWIGTENGVSMYDGNSFTNYTTADGLSNNSILSILVDSQNNIWFGTMGGGVSKFDGSNWTVYTTSDGLASTLVYAIFEDSNSDMWFGTTSGVSKFDGTNWTTYNSSSGLTSNVVSDVNEDSQGNIWVGLWSTGISIFDGTNWSNIDTNTTLVYNQVTRIFRDNNDYMWVGTTDGISVYDNTGTWQADYIVGDGIFDDWVQAIDADSQNNLWFATYTNYLDDGAASKFDGSNWTNYQTADGLASDNVRDVLVENDNTIWFGTILGISKFYLSTGLDNNTANDNKLVLYPNPATDYVYISTDNQEKIVSVSLTDITGRTYAPDLINNESIDVSVFSSGIYILNITTKNNTYLRNLIIN